MALEQTTQIDAIGVERRSGRVILTLIDATNWDDEESHLHLLQDKINSYLRFAESGEIYEKYTDATGRKCVISVIAQHEPTHVGFQFLNVAKATIEQAGFEFRFELRPPQPK